MRRLGLLCLLTSATALVACKSNSKPATTKKLEHAASKTPRKPSPTPAPPKRKETASWSAANSTYVANALARSFLESRGLATVRALLERSPRLAFGPLHNRTTRDLPDKEILELVGKKLRAKGLATSSTSSPAKVDLLLTGMIWARTDINAKKWQLESIVVQLSALSATTAETFWIGLARVRKLLVPSVSRAKGKPAATIRVTRVSLDKTLPGSTQITNRDFQLYARAAARSAATRWLKLAGQIPVISLHQLRNHTPDHLRLELLTAELGAALLATGEARLVAGPLQRQAVRKLKHPSLRELEGDTMLGGALSRKSVGKQKRYQLELSATRRGKTVWTFERTLSR